MATTKVRVWLDDDPVQHFADPPDDDVTVDWRGRTACGRSGRLHWVSLENVDDPNTCHGCRADAGMRPPLEGDHPGPA